MEAYYDASVTASILLQEVMKEMHIKESPENCCKNGLDKKIFRKCAKIIEKEYSNPDYQELDENQLYFEEDDFYFDDFNKAV